MKKWAKIAGVNLAVVVALLVAGVVALECVARWRTDTPLGMPKEGEAFCILQSLIDRLPEVDHQEFLAERQRLVAQALKAQPYSLFSLDGFSGRYISFDGRFGERSVPDSTDPDSADLTVWLFGGSTMQQINTDDTHTISNVIAVELQRAGVSACVRNFGVGTFQSSMELAKFCELLRAVPDQHRPDVVVFYDGYNESHHTYAYGAGNMQRDLAAKLGFFIGGDDASTIRYAASRIASRHSVIARDRLAKRIAPPSIYESPVPDFSEENLMAGVQSYALNAAMIRGICREIGIQPIFVLQPILPTKRQPSDVERGILKGIGEKPVGFARLFYVELRARQSTSPDFLDLSGIFDDRADTVYIDYGHLGPMAGTSIGVKIARRICERALSDPQRGGLVGGGIRGRAVIAVGADINH